MRRNKKKKKKEKIVMREKKNYQETSGARKRRCWPCLIRSKALKAPKLRGEKRAIHPPFIWISALICYSFFRDARNIQKYSISIFMPNIWRTYKSRWPQQTKYIVFSDLSFSLTFRITPSWETPLQNWKDNLNPVENLLLRCIPLFWIPSPSRWDNSTANTI